MEFLGGIAIVLVESVELELLVVGAQVGALVGQWPSCAELTRTFGRSDDRGLLPEARVDEAAPHRGLVEELHVPVRPARQDGEIAVVPLVVDPVGPEQQRQKPEAPRSTDGS